MSGKNGQVFNSLTVFLASNYEQRAIASFFDRNQRSLTSVLTNTHAEKLIVFRPHFPGNKPKYTWIITLAKGNFR